MEPQETNNSNTPLHQTPITIIGPTIFHPKVPGLLEWGADNRIRVHSIDRTTGQYQTLGDYVPNEIKKFGSNIGLVAFKPANGKRLYFEMVPGIWEKVYIGILLFVLLGLIGEIIALFAFFKPSLKQEAASDFTWWKNALAQHGVKSGGFTLEAFATFTTVIIILQVLLFVLGALFLIIAMLASGS